NSSTKRNPSNHKEGFTTTTPGQRQESQRASRQDTPWTECQPIAGHTHTLMHSHTTDNLEMPINLPCMSLDWGRTCKLPTNMAEVGIEPPTLEV
ncbi:hypothetical protein QTP70_032209, partial [Hemibagrus guttatus]